MNNDIEYRKIKRQHTKHMKAVREAKTLADKIPHKRLADACYAQMLRMQPSFNHIKTV